MLGNQYDITEDVRSKDPNSIHFTDASQIFLTPKHLASPKPTKVRFQSEVSVLEAFHQPFQRRESPENDIIGNFAHSESEEGATHCPEKNFKRTSSGKRRIGFDHLVEQELNNKDDQEAYSYSASNEPGNLEPINLDDYRSNAFVSTEGLKRSPFLSDMDFEAKQTNEDISRPTVPKYEESVDSDSIFTADHCVSGEMLTFDEDCLKPSKVEQTTEV